MPSSNFPTSVSSLGAFGPSAASVGAAALAKSNSAAKAGTDAPGNLGKVPTAQDQSDRFLKLLVAQMSNQDPLNPMDSAQVTSQMAQISTVQGVQTLNKTVSGLDAQFTQLQTMQGAALVGHDVAVDGNSVRFDATTNKGDGGFELSTPATSVNVEVLNGAGQTVATAHLGAQDGGRHSFEVDVPPAQRGQPLTFKVTALNNSAAVDAQPLAYSGIAAVSNQDGKLAVELDNGKRVDYAAVKAFL
jgi:flagellar basal-body rod modification protein FlgD